MLRPILALALEAIIAVGCTASVYPEDAAYVDEGYPVEYVQAPPPAIETYPRVYYRGGYHYNVNGRWYRSTPRGWMYYRSAPPQLQQPYVQPRPYIERQRPYIQEAPPAH